MWQMGNGLTYAFKANHSYHLNYLESPPHEFNRWTTEYLHKGDWLRLSFCLQGLEPTVYASEHYISNTGQKSYRDRPESRTPMRRVDSIDALEHYMDGPRPGFRDFSLI